MLNKAGAEGGRYGYGYGHYGYGYGHYGSEKEADQGEDTNGKKKRKRKHRR